MDPSILKKNHLRNSVFHSVFSVRHADFAKKNFAGTEKGRIFAPAFEERTRFAGKRENIEILRSRDSVCPVSRKAGQEDTTSQR